MPLSKIHNTLTSDHILLDGTDSTGANANSSVLLDSSAANTDVGALMSYEAGADDASVTLTASNFTLDSLSVSGTTTLSSSVSGETTFNGAIIPNAGIKFPATQVASTDANTLDDYEEGTFTPVIRGGSTAGTYELNTSFDDGFYQKVGRVVTVRVVVQLAGSISAGGTGSYLFGGLPFNIDVSDNAGAGSILADSVDFAGSDDAAVYALTVSNPSGTDGNQLRILQTNDVDSFTALGISQAAASDFFEFTYNYRTTA